jgi:hypothetical protein
LIPLLAGGLILIGFGAALLHGNQSKSYTPAKLNTVHTAITATLFWIGEPADDSNKQISNVPTAWDEDTILRYGGADGTTKPDGLATDVPRDKNGIVTGFKPLFNPYYFALPATEYGNDGQVVEQARLRSPWAEEPIADGYSRFKGRWIKVTSGSKVIYAQWLDVGPNEEQDYDYVFGDGSQRPKNTFGLKAGLDLSPAAAITLGFNDGSKQVSWQFVDAGSVPDGPWKQYPAIDNKIYWQ